MLVRDAPPGAGGGIEAYLVRRQKGMRFLGGFYAFPGGRVDPADGAPAVLARCRGLTTGEAERLLSYREGRPSLAESPEADRFPALAYWVTAVRELLEETGILLACDEDGRAVDGTTAGVVAAIERVHKAHMAAGASFAAVLAGEGWYCDLSPLRYVSHFITPTASPIRFTARFFLCPVPAGQAPRLFTEETSEGFWIGAAEGHRRFQAGEMAMAEPAEYGLAYLAQFDTLASLWDAHADGRHKFHGIVDRIDGFWAGFDWTQGRWPA
jgi:8-oxo-dGTP pyrophosphatase MutT (NUDIX family)